MNGDPKPGVDNIKQKLRIYPLAEASNPPATNFVDVSGKSFNTIHAMDFSYFEEVNEVVQEEPGAAIDPETLGLLASIGIVKGKPFAPDARMKAILTEAASVGNATARTLAYRSRIQEARLYPDSAWETPFIGGSYEFLSGGARLLDARSFFFFVATGITPAMSIKMVGAGSQYAAAFADSRISGSTGARRTGCGCRPTSRSRISGRWCSTTTRPVRCSRPTSSFRASAARRRGSWSMPIHRWTCISDPRRPPARRPTGCRPGPAKVGS